MSKIFKPRRGKSTTMAGSTKARTVLAAGEMFMEVPSTGVGTGESNIKMGDGTTAYSSLPYAVGSAAPTSITSDASTTATTALNKATSGSSLKTILGALKQAISLNSTSITTLNDTISSMTSTTVKLSTSNTSTDSIGFGVSDGNYGYIIPGADTVTPFNNSPIFGFGYNLTCQNNPISCSVNDYIIMVSYAAMTKITGGDIIYNTCTDLTAGALYNQTVVVKATSTSVTCTEQRYQTTVTNYNMGYFILHRTPEFVSTGSLQSTGTLSNLIIGESYIITSNVFPKTITGAEVGQYTRGYSYGIDPAGATCGSNMGLYKATDTIFRFTYSDFNYRYVLFHIL